MRSSSQESIVVDWIEKEDVQKEMRRKIKDGLREAGFPADEIERAAREFLELSRRCFLKRRSLSTLPGTSTKHEFMKLCEQKFHGLCGDSRVLVLRERRSPKGSS